MNDTIQYILIFFALAIAIGFLVKKFFVKPATKKNGSGCGTDDCGCH